MAAPGTIVLTVDDPMVKRDFPNHLLTSVGGQFDSSLCTTPMPFTIHPKESHVLITDLDKIYGAVLQSPDGRRGNMSIAAGMRTPLRLCYLISLKSPDMMLHVGQATSLTLLLRAGCLEVTSFLVNKEQVARLLPPAQPAASVSATASALASTSAAAAAAAAAAVAAAAAATAAADAARGPSPPPDNTPFVKVEKAADDDE
jgi:hypothetical protein